MMNGTVKWFDSKKGYGFIAGEDGADVFVHYSGIVIDGYKELHEGETVSFDVDEDSKGKHAINVLREQIA
jgi:CspA family cold shock protein